MARNSFSLKTDTGTLLVLGIGALAVYYFTRGAGAVAGAAGGLFNSLPSGSLFAPSEHPGAGTPAGFAPPPGDISYAQWLSEMAGQQPVIEYPGTTPVGSIFDQFGNPASSPYAWPGQ